MTKSENKNWRNFNYYWVAQFFSQLSGQALNIGMPLITAAVYGVDPLKVAATTAIQFIPYLIITPIAGYAVDRMDRLSLLSISFIGRVLVLCCAIGLSYLDALQIEIFWIIVFLLGSLNAIAGVANNALVPDLAPMNSLVKANSKVQLSLSVTQVVGPAIAGVFLALSDFHLFGFLALSYAISIVLIKKITIKLEKIKAEKNIGFKEEFIVGFSFIKSKSILWILLLEMACFNLFEQALITVFMLYSISSLGIGAESVGMIFAIGALGSIIAATFFKSWLKTFSVNGILKSTMGIASLTPFVILMSNGSNPAFDFVVCSLSFFMYGFGLTSYNIGSSTIKHQEIPREYLGRTSAVYRMMGLSTLSFGAALGGILAEVISFKGAIFIACVGLATSYAVFIILLKMFVKEKISFQAG